MRSLWRHRDDSQRYDPTEGVHSDWRKRVAEEIEEIRRRLTRIEVMTETGNPIEDEFFVPRGAGPGSNHRA